ncbi:RNA polymerase sigma-70 factor [Parabacteroides sp. OttesenSCG-928-K15]|nr:RNA polymerase sigma-70 factor [Parabacteroides sp. OttesenSCG-928-K15]
MDKRKSRGEDDRQLLSLLKKENERAFTAIYERYHKLLYVIAYNYLKSAEQAEDAVQFVFLKLWEARKALMIEVNLKNYLFTMLKHHVLNEIRNNLTAIEKNYEMAQSSPEYEDGLIARIEEKELMERFYEAIDRLPEQKKQVCLLKLQGNLSNQEIAERMQISVPTVKTHYAQSIKMLRTYFERMLLVLIILFIS